MSSTFNRVLAVQGNEMADVVCKQDSTLAGGIVQNGWIIQAPFVDIINAEGIYSMPAELRSQIGIHILVNEQGYRDCPCVPWEKASFSRWISVSISGRWS